MNLDYYLDGPGDDLESDPGPTEKGGNTAAD
mgnify:FL=1